MQNFTVCNPTKIIFGAGQIAALEHEIPRNARILLIYGGGSIKRNGVYQQVRTALQQHYVVDFGGVEANPKLDQLVASFQLIKEHQIDFLLAVGGGSVIDGTKFIAAAYHYAGDPWEIVSQGRPQLSTVMPFGVVLTLPATGSEMNCGAVISRRDVQDKLSFEHPGLYPQFSILDPTTTFTLPRKQTANGIVDTFAHVIEQYLTYPVGAMIQDRFAEGIILTLIAASQRVLAQPEDYIGRANLMWAATWGLNDFIGVGVPNDWASHALSHEITACFGLDHGEALAVVIPSLLRVKSQQKREKILQLGERVWALKQGTDLASVERVIQSIEDFFISLGVKTKLGDYGIRRDQVARLVERLEQHGRTALGEHQDIDLAQSREIYDGCF